MSAFKRPLVLGIMVMSIFGLLAIYSATAAEWGTSYVARQGVWIALGLAAMVGMTHVRTKTLEAFAPVVYAASVLLLLAVLLLGTGPHGAKRWFNLGFMRFQPSEVAKIAAIMMLARYLSGRKVVGDSIRGVLMVFSILALPALLVLYEPDMGTALVIAFVGFPMLYAAGLDTLYLAFLVSPFIAVVAASEIVTWVIFIGFLVTVMVLARFRTSFVALIFGINFLVGSLAPRIWMGLEPYQRERIEAFLNPEAHSQGAGFQSIQAKIAVGSGGLVGKGLFDGTQKALGLVPEQHTDFVFSVIGEELGFLGGIAVLALLAYVITRLFQMARLARDPFTTYLSYGFASMILIQAVVNVGMNMGMIPVTGITLPFLSYGGSSTLVLLATTGVVIAGYASRKG